MERSGEVDAGHFGEAKQSPKDVGELVGKFAAAAFVGKPFANFVVGQEAEVFKNFAGFDRKGQPEVFRVMKLFPVAFSAEVANEGGEIGDRGGGIGGHLVSSRWLL